MTSDDKLAVIYTVMNSKTFDQREKRLTLLEAGADCLGWLVKERYGLKNRRKYRTVNGFVMRLMY
ncbi:hypothetical protein [uncultured Bacteroides sp.]|uniref:hypothetical protein n=1 Tax=uncultured Bacteroides sp. TaxID=162156 RepID=UPI00280BF093|nr:hypothetical protein [uncultured Bacteroides sp.]